MRLTSPTAAKNFNPTGLFDDWGDQSTGRFFSPAFIMAISTNANVHDDPHSLSKSEVGVDISGRSRATLELRNIDLTDVTSRFDPTEDEWPVQLDVFGKYGNVVIFHNTNRVTHLK
jgi:hypothetical protein